MQSGWNSVAIACVALLWGAAGGVRAEDSASPPPVPLERLLTVPRDVELSTPRYGGATRAEWRARFDEARAQRREAQAALEAAQKELGEIAADTEQWQMTAPGLGGAKSTQGESGPLSYRLSQEIRRQREEIERADRRLQELRVEAELAGMPDEWIDPEP